MRLLESFLYCMLLSLACSGVIAVRIEGRISTNAVLPDLSLLRPATRIVLNGNTHSAFVRKDGSFALDNVPEGNHLLEVESIDYLFPKMRLDVDSDKVHPTFYILGTEWDSSATQPAPYPLNISAAAQGVYFLERPGFQIASLFANPMMLMMGFSLIMLLLIPKIQSSLDPEMLQEVEETRQKLLNPTKGTAGGPSLSAALAGVDQQKSTPKKAGKRR